MIRSGQKASTKFRWRALLTLVQAMPVIAMAQALTPPQAPASTPTRAVDVSPRACELAVPRLWPSSALERRAQLRRMDASKDACIRHPAFLAALGGLWLEDGEPELALIWLERSLLLDPHNLGAQADHALALAALGEPDGLAALAEGWRNRTDIPPALQDKLLRRGAPLASAPLPKVRLGTVSGSAWVNRAEATLLLGHESNLDRSPRLDEITLTPPEGPISLPVDTVARRGLAALTDLSWQFARKGPDGQVWRAGVSVAARAAPHENKTDWHQVQFAVGGAQTWGPWRGQVDSDFTLIGGPLNEPFRTWRTRLMVERATWNCSSQTAMEVESRSQSRTATADSTTLGLLWATTCPNALVQGWAVGGALRVAVDRPTETGRPGGTQRFWNAGLRLRGRLGADIRLDANLRYQRAADDEGYNALLDYNARRRLAQTQLALELAKPIGLSWAQGADALLQINAIEQRSNLALFRSHSASVYSGVRWAW